jgi:predicted DNA-binding transcriptional regulator YafY
MHPLELVFHGGRIHLGGVSFQHHQFLLFAIDKSFDFELTNQPFSRTKLISKYKTEFDKLFGIAVPKNDKIYKIKIEFTESLGNSAKNFFFHKSQTWSQMPNGNYILEMQCSIGREIFGFLGLMLDKVKVHQPKILKNLLIRKAKQITKIHQQNLDLNEELANADY